MNEAKHILTSKTIWASIATVATGLAMYFGGEQSLQDLLISVIGVVFGVLRWHTEKPVTFNK